MKKILFILVISLLSVSSFAANYPLDIINVDEVGANNRIKFAYPGIEYKVVISAFGGTYPFTWELTTAPSGMVINPDTGEISWPNPLVSGSPHSVTVKVTDSESSTDIESYTVTVTDSTDRFLFVDIANGNSGNTGTILSPLAILDDFWLSDHTGKIVYFRTGTYLFPKNGGSNDRHTARVPISSTNPLAYLGYPGETVTMNGQSEVDNAGIFGYCWYTTQNDTYFENTTFNNTYFYSLTYATSDYSTIYNCTFSNMLSVLTPPADGHNQSHINSAEGDLLLNMVVHKNTFLSAFQESHSYAIMAYSNRYLVVQDNSVSGQYGGGFFLKFGNDHVAIRHNEFSNTQTGFSGQQIGVYNDEQDIEICFNFFSNHATALYFEDTRDITTPGAQDNNFIYRNTFYNAAIHFRANRDLNSYKVGGHITTTNIMQNELLDTGTPSVSDSDFVRNHIQYDNVTLDEYNRIISDQSDNLTGVAADNIVDSDGLLIGSYRDTYLGTIGWETACNVTVISATGTTGISLTGTTTIEAD